MSDEIPSAGTKSPAAFRVLFGHGANASHKGTDINYGTVSWPELIEEATNPPVHAKGEGRWIICSDYNGPDGRVFGVQRERGRFWLLPLDIDSGNPSLDDVLDVVEAALGGPHEALIYATRSSTEANRKWRVLVPLAAPVEGRLWSAFVRGFNRRIVAGGLVPDAAMERTAQLVYTPNRGAFYDAVVADGGRFDPSAWIAEAEAVVAAKEAAFAAAREEAKAAPYDRPGIITEWCALHPLDDVLEACGYTYEGGRSLNWRSPLQQSTNFGTMVIYRPDGVPRWISLSDSDANAWLGKASVGDDSRWGDAFDIWVHFKHGGNFDKALEAAKLEVAPHRVEASAGRMARLAERLAASPAGAQIIADAEALEEDRADAAQAEADGAEEAREMLVLHLKSIKGANARWFDLATPSSLSSQMNDLMPTSGLEGRYGRAGMREMLTRARVTADWPVVDPRHPYGFVQTGWHGEQPLGVVNCYCHRAVNPEASTDDGHWAMRGWREMMAWVFPVEAERIWAEQWFATKAHKPWERMVALVNATTMTGTGRGLMTSLVTRLFGRENCEPLRALDFTPEGSRFNHYMEKTLAIMDEMNSDGGERTNQRAAGKAIYDVMKDCVDPGEKFVSLNRKFGQKKTIQSFTSFLLLTNHEDALPIPANDRRFMITKGNDERATEAFADMVVRLRDSEEALDVIWRHLMERVDLTAHGFSPFRVMDTAARQDMIEAQVTDLDHELAGVLADAGWPLFLSMDILRLAANLTDAGVEKRRDSGHGVLDGALRNWLSNHTMPLPQPEGSSQEGARGVKVNGKVVRIRVWREALQRRGTTMKAVTGMPPHEVAAAAVVTARLLLARGKFKPTVVEE